MNNAFIQKLNENGIRHLLNDKDITIVSNYLETIPPDQLGAVIDRFVEGIRRSAKARIKPSAFIHTEVVLSGFTSI